MEKKYEDYCVCSPETYEVIAKKYSEQISQRSEKEVVPDSGDNLISTDKVAAFLSKAVRLAERLQNSNRSAGVQKVYIKTFKLFEVAKKELDLSSSIYDYQCLQSQDKNPYRIKNESIHLLCGVLKELLLLPHTQTAQSTIDTLNSWSEIL